MHFHIIPNAHIDPVWLWDQNEGLNQAVRSIRSTLELMDEFPFLTYMRGEAALYRHLEATDPEAFKRVLKRIREGRWDVVGGTEVQSDTNLPAAETLMRQYDIGLEYMRSRLGVRPRVAWAADSFGHCAGLPEILSAAGMEYFAFTRPFPSMRPTPKPAFWWRGPSGARILCYRPQVGWYGTRLDEVPPRLDEALVDASQRDLDNVPVFIGVGDHGGGPSRKQIRQVLAWAEAHPEVRVEWSGLSRFFDALRAEAATKGGDDFFPEITGELGYTLRGCYTSAARHKFAFRRAEAELSAAERIASLVNLHSSTFTRHSSLSPCVVESADGGLNDAWRKLLFNSFHDILPGTCIERAAAEQFRQLGAVRDTARATTFAALNALSFAADTSVPRPKGDFPAELPFLIFNPHPWEYRGQVEFEGCIDDNAFYFEPFGGGQAPLVVRDAARRRIPFQIIPAEAEFGNVVWRSRVIADARIPAFGFAVYTLGRDVRGAGGASGTGTASESTTNSTKSNASPVPFVQPAPRKEASRTSLFGISLGHFAISVRVGSDGIRILRDGKPWLKGSGLQALLFRDPKGSWGDDAARQYDESTPPVAWRVEHVEVTESGPLRSALFVRLAGERSWLELTLRLAVGRDAIDCEARLLWNERMARLKLSLPCGAKCADYAVPGAVVRRDAAIGEVPVGPWVRPIGRDGAATLGFASDALYGFDMADGALRPSVVRATGFSFGLGQDVPLDAWRAATDIGEHRFRFLLAPGDADLPRLAAELEQPPAIILAPNSELGPLGRSGSLAALSPASLHVMAIKPADDGTGDLILRVQETAGRPAKVSFTIGGRQHVLGRIGANAIATWHVRR